MAVEKPAAHGIYEVLAQRDADIGVWAAESEDVPGLVAESEPPNGLAHHGVPSEPAATFHIRYRHEESAAFLSTNKYCPGTPRARS